MNIVKLFKEHHISISLILYEENDLTTIYELRELIENIDFFTELFKNYRLVSIKTNDDFLIYMLGKKIIALKDYLHIIKSSKNRDKILNLIRNIKKLNFKDFIGESIKFVNKNYEKLLVPDNKNTFEENKAVLELISRNQNAINNEVFVFLCKNYQAYLLSEFDYFKNYFKKNPDQFELFINNGQLLELNSNKLNLVLNMFLKVKDIKKFQRTIDKSINNIFNSLIQKLEVEKDTSNVSFTMSNLDMVNALSLYFKKTKDKRYNRLKKYPDLLEKKIDCDLEKNGVEIQTDIPLTDVIDLWFSKIPKDLRLFCLTHKLSSDNKVHSIFDLNLIVKNEKASLIDIINSNLPRDDYYTFYRQEKLNNIITIGEGLLLPFFKGASQFKELENDIQIALKYLDSENEIENDIFEKGSLLLAALKKILPISKLENNKNNFTAMSECYNVQMLCCSLIEKLLRIVYIDHNQSIIYIREDKTTLGVLLENSNFPAFGKDHLKSLAFFLLKSGEKQIGYNYRNRLAHLSKVDYSILSPGIAMQMLYLFIDVLNSACFYFSKKN